MCEIKEFSSLSLLGSIPEESIEKKYKESVVLLDKKIVVLDDDPTGIQTVHDVPVYTDWEEDTLFDAFDSPENMFYVLTNSRGLTTSQTVRVHTDIAKRIAKISAKTGKDYILISRSDSTLRGYYPLETQVLKDTIEAGSDKRFDGEIICPFFLEGGRFTFGDVHYVKMRDGLVPAGLTEFAKDKSFAYNSSDLKEWVEEKTAGAYKSESVVSISIDELRSEKCDDVYAKLTSVKNFGKIIVNAVSFFDLKSFMVSFVKASLNGYNYIFRSAAAIPKVIGNISDIPLLDRSKLVPDGNPNGGIVVVGSHVNKTTEQLNELKRLTDKIIFIELNQHLVVEEGNKLDLEAERVRRKAEEFITKGITAVVYTKRERIDFGTDDPDKQLELSVRISNAVTSVVADLTVNPSFVIAKGGITSSEVGVKALRVKKANVLGQIRPGVPVWQTGKESKFPFLPYVIFPGNVGSIDDLRIAVETLIGFNQ